MSDCPFKDPHLNPAEILSLAALNSSVEEIAAYFGVDSDVIQEFYMPTVKRGWMQGKIKVRQLMMDRALDANNPDPKAIDFVAKHFLGGEGGHR